VVQSLASWASVLAKRSAREMNGGVARSRSRALADSVPLAGQSEIEHFAEDVSGPPLEHLVSGDYSLGVCLIVGVVGQNETEGGGRLARDIQAAAACLSQRLGEA
jgi:hypothetical protein